MPRGRPEVAVEPRRVVVELSPEEFAAIDKAAGGHGPADYLRAVGLRLATLENEPARPRRA